LSKVSLVHCDSYENGKLEGAVRSAVDLIGGISAFVSPGDSVLLKPNLLSAKSPERCVTTHPAVVRAVARMVMDAGGRPFLGDSPALESFGKVAAKTGMAEVASELNIELVEFSQSTPAIMSEGAKFKKLELAAQALQADVVVNLPKLKTHSQMLLTLGIKNLFGAVVAQRKAEWHYMIGMSRDAFADLHLEIYLTLRPALTILDGVWGMEGHGPANGTPRRVNMLAAAEDPVALDVSTCHILGIPLRLFPLYRAARSRRVGETDIERIDFKGMRPDAFRVQGFNTPSLDSLGVLPGAFDWFAKRFLVSKPVQVEQACIGCGECSQICPAEAIQLEAKKIDFDYDRCIRCYCCQEVCPQDSIGFHRGLLLRLLHRFNR
jgi:uncharacterized protein (DUF362 family)/Pyruvate/2-oxoacid:ferredoxin oxidoreductase delta subunit